MATASTRTGVEGSRRLFIGNLPPFARYKDLLKAFLEDGARAAHIVKRGKMRIGFVTFDTPDAANAALGRIGERGLVLYKRSLVVKKADPWHDLKVTRSAAPKATGEVVHSKERSPTLDLPLEAIARIASFLPYVDRTRMECVSRAWRQGSLMSHGQTTRLITAGPMWEVDWGRSLITTEGFYWAIQRTGPTLRSLTIHDDHCETHLRSCILTIAAKACKNLEHVDLRATVTRPAGLRELTECTSHLSTLVLGRSWGAVDPDLHRLLERNHELRRLELYAFGLRGGALGALTTRLEALVVDQCPRLEAEHLAKFLGEATHLTELRILNGLSLRGGSVLQALTTNGAHRTNLKALTIHATDFRQPAEPVEVDEGERVEEEEDWDDEEQAPEYPPGFEEAQFLELERMEHEAAPGLPANLLAITQLSLTALAWVDEWLVREIAAQLSGLDDLNLSHCTNVRGTDALEPLSQLSGLKVLRLNHLHPTAAGAFLADLNELQVFEARGWLGLHTEEVCALLRNSPNLSHLDLESCRQITRPVVRTAIEVTRRVDREVRLELFVGGTSISWCKKDRPNFYLGLHYGRRSGHLL